MTRTKAEIDAQIRRYALDHVRNILRELDVHDRWPRGGDSKSPEWRYKRVDMASKWASIAEALRPDRER